METCIKVPPLSRGSGSATKQSPHRQLHSSTTNSPLPPSLSSIEIYIPSQDAMASVSPTNNGIGALGPPSNGGSVSPKQTTTPKNVAFELLFLDSPQCRARLPMRVQIYPHDTTDSIVTTVKNFYGLYSGPTGSKGVSFEDDRGNTLIARYENFSNNMVVYVRVIEEPPVTSAAYAPYHYHNAPVGAQAFYGAEGYPVQQPQRFAQDISRPESRTSRRRSPSQNSARGRRSASTSTSGKNGRSRSSKSHNSGVRNHAESYPESINGYSSGEDAHSTVSGKNKEQLGNTDISVENIVEGGRRKRAKFESSVSAGAKRSLCVAQNTDNITTTGIALICSTTDAGRNFEPFCFSCSTYRTAPTSPAFCPV